MGTIAFHRPARTYPPDLEPQRVPVPPPPQRAAEGGAQQWLYLLLPLLSSVSMGAYLVTFGKAWMVLLGVGFIVLSTGITLLVRNQTRRAGRRDRDRQRRLYREHLALLRARARESAAVQRAAALFQHPSPARLWALATGRRRVWERRPADPDFLQLRIGAGNAEPLLRLQASEGRDPTVDYDRVAQRAARRLTDELAVVPHQPAWVDLGRAGVVSIVGPSERARPVAANLLLQAAVLHSPDDVAIAVLATDYEAWSWATWLPHTRGPAGIAVATSVDGLADIIDARLEVVRAERAERPAGFPARRDRRAEHHFLLVVDGYGPGAPHARDELLAELLQEAGPDTGLHVVCLSTREADEPGRVDARVRAGADGGLTLESRQPGLVSTVTDVVADPADAALREYTARTLAALRLSGEREQTLTTGVSLPGLLGTDLAGYDPPRLWRAADDPALLRVPLGVTAEGTEVVLDLKESAQGGVGPHGLLVGATGSGKSELLRTLVAGLAMTHSPDHLGMVLVDFKGGATFAGVTDLPHVAGLITNLVDDLALVERMRVALHGEQRRRQQLLRDAGNVDTVREYQLLREAGGVDQAGQPLPPLPYLVVVVDEFGELMAQRPDFLNLFVQIGRLGRSLGIHLLLASQRLDEGRLRGLESHLSYRIALRTFSAAESRAVIGTVDAYRLPPIPGSAYLKVGESTYERFRVAHVSAPYVPAGPVAPTGSPAPAVLGPRSAEDARRAAERAAEPEPEPSAPVLTTPGAVTQLRVIVERIRPCGQPVHQVWLPPLPAAVELDALLGGVRTDPVRGHHAATWSGDKLTFPIGVVDLPARQEQRVLSLRIDDAGGHIAVVGAPQTGKSTLLRTAALSAMLTHTPDELQFTAIDFGGGSLGPLQDAPHVTGVAARADEERTRRALAVTHQLLARRERYFREAGVDSVAEFRRRRDAGELPPGLNAADHVLIIDNWPALRAAVDVADQIVLDVSARGLGVGVHLMITANRWSEIRTNLRDNIGGRLELRLNEPGESEISRPQARALVAHVPGRGLTPPGNLMQAALPRADGEAGTDNLAKAQQALIDDLAAGWPGPPAEPLRTLPHRITPADLAAAGALDTPGVAIGLRELDLAPVALDLDRQDPHLLVFGDSGSGKTTFLRTWMRGLAEHRTPRELRFVVVDYRGGLLDAVPPPYLGAHAGDGDQTRAYVSALAERLAERRPPAGLTAAQRRERSWWEGPEFYVVVDDHDLVGSPGPSGNPLAGLVELLGNAGDVGLHLVLARRVGGLTRALVTDPALARLREFDSAALILSGDPREGVLIGDQRAARRHPGRGVLVSRSTPAQLVQLVDGPATDTEGAGHGR